MARWRLREKHYLNVRTLPDGTDVVWEQKETSQQTGRSMRKVYPVPLLLDPDIGSDHNHPLGIVVCFEGKGAPGDIEFIGDPTPDMEPLDDEAKKISASFKERWIHPIESLENGFSGALLSKLEAAIGALAQKAPPTPSQEMTQMMQMVRDLQEEVALLRAERAAAEEPLEELEEA